VKGLSVVLVMTKLGHGWMGCAVRVCWGPMGCTIGGRRGVLGACVLVGFREGVLGARGVY